MFGFTVEKLISYKVSKLLPDEISPFESVIGPDVNVRQDSSYLSDIIKP